MEETERHRRQKRYQKVFIAAAVTAVATAAAVLLLTHFVCTLVRISGNTMSPTFFDGDVVAVIRTSSLKRGDICIFELDGSMLCKRVIGIGGDEIKIDESGTVYVNGEAQEEPYLRGQRAGESTVEYPVTVPQGSYFVAGDNRRMSIDSRHTAVGMVEGVQVTGRVCLRLLPTPAIPE